REGTFGQDGAFSWEAMAARYNADLANDLGNLVSRSLAMVTSYFGGLVPEPGETTEAERALAARAARAAEGLDRGVESLDLREALRWGDLATGTGVERGEAIFPRVEAEP